jgi:3-hydroxyacyl-CoA dehydrogenase
MAQNASIRRIAVVGTGVIGASWAALYLARGFQVVATDPGPNAEESLRRMVDLAWGALSSLGLAPGASPKKLEFTSDLQRAVSSADFVQENAPERPDLKAKLFADLDRMTPEGSVIASSSSGLTMTSIQAACTRYPERCVIGHPFNPPHLMPLVEVVGGQKTSADTIERAIGFYRSIGKKPIRLHKEVVGHVANRLQAALYREMVHLIEQGVLSVSDADVAVCWGPGLRWGVMGPSLLFHLGGGEGGIRHFMEHLAGPMAAWWKDLGTITDLSPEVKRTIVEGVLQEAGGRSIEELEKERDEELLGLLRIRRENERKGGSK